MKNFNFLLLLLINCYHIHSQVNHDLEVLMKDQPYIDGKTEYLGSPFVTAGNRMYLVGHQDGSFKELGWHIKDEMGGIWNHPIKVFDAIDAEIVIAGDTIPLNKASNFRNYPTAGRHLFKLKEKNLKIERWQFIAESNQGLLIQYKIKNLGNTEKDLRFLLKASSDLRPTWLGERTEMIDGPDSLSLEKEQNLIIFKDSLNPWYGVIGTNLMPTDYSILKSPYKGLGRTGMVEYDLNLKKEQEIILNVFVAASYNSEDDAREEYTYIKNNIGKEILQKNKKYAGLSESSRLTIPDMEIEEAFEWLKYNAAWLVQEVPEIGTGITAGIPDYPWWFGVDSEYALKGYMAIGQTEPVYKTIQLLDSISNKVNGNGRIIHEMSTNAAVFNKGNINETPQFASLIWEIYKWNGDLSFLKKYWPTIVKGLDWLMTENDSNKNLFPDGFGMMEIHGLDSEMIDVATYTQKAFADAAEMAKVLRQDSLNLHYDKIARTLKKEINEKFWSEDFKSFADFIGTDEQALRLIEDAIVRADTLKKPWSVKELQQTKQYLLENPSEETRPFVLHHNWVVNTPMEMGIADERKAKLALKTARNYINPFGVFVTGIDRDEKINNEGSSFQGSKAFSYTGAVMTLPTGVQAVAENNYGNPDMALDYLKRMTRSFSYALPGSMYEVSPDYGMMTQAWNIYGFAVPIVQQFFGIKPFAGKKLVTIKPQMPTEWEYANLENVNMGDNSVSIYYSRNQENENWKIIKTNPAWTIEVILPPGEYLINDQKQNTNENLNINSRENSLDITRKLR